MPKNIVNNKNERNKKIIIFLISPFMAFLYSLRHMNTKSSFAVFYGFAICFGMAFSVEAYESLNYNTSGIDAGRYRLEFERSANMSSAEFYRDLNTYFDFDEGDKDFYYISMVYLVSRFTHNYHWLFMAFAIVFAFFQLKALKFLVEEENWRNGLFCIILAAFFTWNQIFNINAMRFYTAAWIAVYAVFQIFLKGRKRYLMLLAITPFFHTSFFLISSVIVFAFFLKRFELFWIILFIVSFFGSTVFAEIINMVADYLPDFMAETARGYTDEERLYSDITFSGSGFWWVPMMFDRLYKIYTNLIVALFIINRNKIKKDKCKNLYLFAVIFMTFINFSIPIPALGRRTIVMIYPIIAYIWISYFGTKKHSWLIYIFPIIWAWQIMTYFNYYNTVIDFSFLVSSPIYMIAKYLL